MGTAAVAAPPGTFPLEGEREGFGAPCAPPFFWKRVGLERIEAVPVVDDDEVVVAGVSGHLDGEAIVDDASSSPDGLRLITCICAVCLPT